MQSSAQWLRSNLHDMQDISDDEINVAGERPSENQYVRLDKVDSLVIHHSATETGCARVFRALHRAVNGWVDIGYHFVIGNGTLSEDGEIESGRPIWSVGAHARKHNNNSIGICLVGNFNLFYPTEKQRHSLTVLLRELIVENGLSRADIVLHRDVPGCNTECPGDKVTSKWITETL
ncbi:MAG: peptidoglycan recognition protein family protein [Candidatus Aegiribacteria sp.]|nr:peptidoglycan recognition protein family protein [Candidatus Aegiribacteria sp.]